MKLLKEKGLKTGQIPVPPKELHKLIKIIAEGKISITAGQEVFSEMFNTGRSAGDIVNEKGLSQISNRTELERIITDVLNDNPQSLKDYTAGKKQAAVFLMGRIMKASKGKANPQLQEKYWKRSRGCCKILILQQPFFKSAFDFLHQLLNTGRERLIISWST